MKNSMNYSLLKNEELLTFADRFLMILKSSDVAGMGFDVLSQKLEDSNILFNQTLDKDLKQPYTLQLEALDSVRDNSYYAFRLYIESCMYSKDVNVSNAASRIMAVIKRHGYSISSMGYKRETAMLTGIIGELKTSYADDIVLTGVESRLDALAEDQVAFEETIRKSMEGSPATPTLTELKTQIKSLLGDIMKLAEIQVQVQQNEALNKMVEAFDNLILNIMTTARSAATRAQKQD